MNDRTPQTEQERLSEAKRMLFLLGNANPIYRLCYNLLDYAQAMRRDYKPFERLIKLFEKWEASQ
jgi:hypothetical protein